MNRSIPLQVCDALARVVSAFHLAPNDCAVSLAPSYDVAQGDSGLKLYAVPSNVNFGQKTRGETTIEVASNIVALCKTNDESDVDDALNALCFIASALTGGRLEYGENSLNVKSVVLAGAGVVYGSDWKGAEDDIQIDGLYNRAELADANVFSSTLVVNCQGTLK